MAEAAHATDSQRAAARQRNLRRVLNPRQVAVIGGRAAEAAVRQLEQMGFVGDIWPVNPHREQMGGRRCFAAIRDLPQPPDAAVVAVPAPACPAVFAELNARGAGGGICFAARFAEEGAGALERELVEAAGDCALIGPNCHGVLNYLDGVALWPDDHGGEPVDAGCALISQSGNVALNATFHQRSLPLAYVIAAGNQAQLELADFIEALLADERVRAIGLFVEGVKDVARLARAAWRALERGVPIVALKVGASAAGARASLSHTAALTGSDTVYEALFDRLGIRRAETPSELLETLKLLCVTGPLGGRRVMSLSCSGGEAALMGDLLDDAGLACPPPGEAAAAAVAGHFRIPEESIGNPLDYNTWVWGDSRAGAAGFEAVLRADYDVSVLLLDFPPPGRVPPDNWRGALTGFLAARDRVPAPAAVLGTLPEALPEEARRDCLAAGVAPLQGLHDGIRALAHAAAYAERRAELLQGVPWTGPVAGGPAAEPQALDEAESKTRLAAHGLTVPAGRVVTAAAAPAAAAELGFPVVLKAVSPALSHKSELGAVMVGLRSRTEVADAIIATEERLRAGGRVIDGWLVETMIPDAVAELIVGVVRDAAAGLALVIGSGGVLVELTRETRTLLLPTSAGEIRRALRGLSVGALLEGYRGRERGDSEAAVAACLAVAGFAQAHAGRLVELDINPLLVRPAGRGVVAADALIRISPESRIDHRESHDPITESEEDQT